MNIFDIIFGIFLLFLMFQCLRKGFVAGSIQLLGLIVTIIVIGKVGHLVKAKLILQFGLGETLAVIIAYIIIFLIIMIMVKIVIFFIHRMVEFLHLKWLNKLLGALFGLFNGVLLIALLMIILNISPFEKEIRKITAKSYILNVVRAITDEIEDRYPQIEKIKKPIRKKLDKKIDKSKEKLEEEKQKIEEIIS